jgi:hypothetical protein
MLETLGHDTREEDCFQCLKELDPWRHNEWKNATEILRLFDDSSPHLTSTNQESGPATVANMPSNNNWTGEMAVVE